jgi:hypothetical protein
MKTGIAIAIVVFCVGMLFAGVMLAWGVGTYNQATTLRNQYEAKLKANEAVFDNMWKKISQSTEVTNMQKEALKDIFVGHAAARAGSGGAGSFINAVREVVPNVDTSIFKALMNVITGSRDEWTANQVALVDIAREYNLMLQAFPSNILLGAFSFKPIEVKLITSTRTDTAFKTGKDDEVALKK